MFNFLHANKNLMPIHLYYTCTETYIVRFGQIALISPSTFVIVFSTKVSNHHQCFLDAVSDMVFSSPLHFWHSSVFVTFNCVGTPFSDIGMDATLPNIYTFVWILFP